MDVFLINLTHEKFSDIYVTMEILQMYKGVNVMKKGFYDHMLLGYLISIKIAYCEIFKLQSPCGITLASKLDILYNRSEIHYILI